MAVPYLSAAAFLLFAWAAYGVWLGFYNFFLHPLTKFPGPKLAGVTYWYQTWQQVFLSRSWCDVLTELHEQYGEIVRVGPNELHFSKPSVYLEMYNNSNRWDKDGKLYHSFGEDGSSFGLLKYAEAKQRKDVILPMFSRKAIIDLQSLVQDRMDRLCKALAANNVAGKSSDMLFGLRCFTLDTITTYCFAKDMNATSAPDFQAPIIVAMNSSLPGFLLFRHFDLLRQTVFGMPGWLTRFLTPAMSGLVDLQEMLFEQVDEVSKNPEYLKQAPHPIIYHRLLDPTSKSGVLPRQVLYEEAQTMVFAGSDTVGNATMVGSFHILRNPAVHAKLKAELKAAWPDLNTVPDLQKLEKLPYLTAVIREALRISPNVPSPLPRVVPPSGTKISGEFIPGGTVVGMSALFVQYSESVFHEPHEFAPERWLQGDAAKLDQWIVAFSKGPRACLGQNLAMCELYIAFASLFRRFDMELHDTTEEILKFTDCFVPAFSEKRMHAFCRPVKA